MGRTTIARVLGIVVLGTSLLGGIVRLQAGAASPATVTEAHHNGISVFDKAERGSMTPAALRGAHHNGIILIDGIIVLDGVGHKFADATTKQGGKEFEGTSTQAG